MNDLLAEGLNLMLLGMGAVFVFLTLLVFITGFMSKLVGRYSPAIQPTAVTPAPVTPASTAGDNQQLLAVITAAIHKHRSRQK